MQLKEGDKVHYTTSHGAIQNGIVKSVTESAIFVVYSCGGDWENYRDYTGQNTPLERLQLGWKDPY